MSASKPVPSHRRDFVEHLERRLKEKSPLIQVILGPRQVGKTTGVMALRQALSGSAHYASADDVLAPGAEWIQEEWQKGIGAGSKTAVIILDEVQKILLWSDRIKALWDRSIRENKRVKLVLLGSSSLSLTQGLGDSLAGRFEVIPARHWGFHESESALGMDLDEYLVLGGYPRAAEFRKDPMRWRSYFQNSILEAVIAKDILRYAKVAKPALFRQTFELLTAYPAQEVSLNKLLGQLQESGNVDVVKYYLSLFESAFLFSALQKYSGSHMRRKASSPKILPLCPALCGYRHAGTALSKEPELRGRLFEAAVGAELHGAVDDLYYWREGDDEVDYVVELEGKLFAIEVKSGRRKRGRGLLAFEKKYPQSKICFLSESDYRVFSRDPRGWLKRC